MSRASLTTLPVEVRQLIWRHTVPSEVHIEVPGCRHTGWNVFAKTPGVVIPHNPRVPILLLCKQFNREIETAIPETSLHVLAHDTLRLDEWIQGANAWERRHVTRIRIDCQEISEWEPTSADNLQSSKEWWRIYFENELVRYYGVVEVESSEIRTERQYGLLDMTFAVGAPHGEKKEWDEKRFSRMLKARK